MKQQTAPVLPDVPPGFISNRQLVQAKPAGMQAGRVRFADASSGIYPQTMAVLPETVSCTGCYRHLCRLVCDRPEQPKMSAVVQPQQA